MKAKKKGKSKGRDKKKQSNVTGFNKTTYTYKGEKRTAV